MSQQLTAFDRRIRIFSGEFKSFDEESKDLFGIAAPVFPESHYAALLDSLNKILPGERRCSIPVSEFGKSVHHPQR
jgi:hypothetical protein